MDPSQLEHFSRIAASLLKIKDPTDTDEILQKVLYLGESLCEHRAKSKKVMEQSGVRSHPRQGFHENRHVVEDKKEKNGKEDEFDDPVPTTETAEVALPKAIHDENMEALDALSRLRHRSHLLTKKNRHIIPARNGHISTISSEERAKRNAARIDSLKGLLET